METSRVISQLLYHTFHTDVFLSCHCQVESPTSHPTGYTSIILNIILHLVSQVRCYLHYQVMVWSSSSSSHELQVYSICKVSKSRLDVIRM